MNVVNSLLGRIHLSGQTAKIDGARRELLKEGLACHRAIADFKKKSVPFFPIGLNRFNSGYAAAGIRNKDKAYLAVWNLDPAGRTMEIPLGKIGEKVAVTEVYPKDFGAVKYTVKNNVLKINFTGVQARFFGLNI